MSLIIFSFTSCDCVEGEGPIELDQREVEGFNKISLGINAKLILTQEENFFVRVDAQSNILELLETDVQGKTLKIGYGFNCVSEAKDIKIHISMPEIEEIDVSGSGQVICPQRFKTRNIGLIVSGSGGIMIDLAASEIETEVSGSGKIDVSGKAKKLNCEISGSGSLYAFNLRATDTRVKISGSGDAKVYPLSTLDARINGSGSVYYKGEPEIRTDINGSGQVLKKNLNPGS